MQNNKYIALLKKEGNKYFIRNRDYYKSDKKNYQIYDLLPSVSSFERACGSLHF